MITWVTVWVLTVTGIEGSSNGMAYQLTYAKQESCLIQIKRHASKYRDARCNFQQIPVVTK